MYKYRRDLNTTYPPSHHHNAFMDLGTPIQDYMLHVFKELESVQLICYLDLP